MHYHVGLVMGTPRCALYSNQVQWQGCVNRVLHHSQGRLVGKQTYHDQNTFTSLDESCILENTLHRGDTPIEYVTTWLLKTEGHQKHMPALKMGTLSDETFLTGVPTLINVVLKQYF